jgi:hypothetical protein
MQRGLVIAPQDATLHALSRSRDSRGALGGIPCVQHVRQMGITSSSDRRHDPLAVVRDQVLHCLSSGIELAPRWLGGRSYPDRTQDPRASRIRVPRAARRASALGYVIVRA